MEFGVLGPLVVWAEGRELRLGGTKQRAVLGALLLHANELAPTEAVVDAVWGKRPPATAVKAVQNYVSELRKVLGKGVVETRPSGYVLRVEPGALDLQRFEALRDQGRRLLADGAAEDAGRVLRTALALWRGPALADFRPDAFARDEIRRLDELRLATLELRLEADLSTGRSADAVSELEALVRAHPRREHLLELLMLALYRAGRQAEALVAYQDTRRMLVDDLGLEPSQSLQRLEQSILRQDPSLDLPLSAAAPAGEARVETRKVVTVLLSSAVGETGLATSRYFELASAAVTRHGGTVESFVGDEVTAVFGVPAVREDDALRAVSAAIEVRDALPGLGMYPRIGVDTGEVLVGDSAAGRREITGYPLAVGKRLEEAAAPGEVLIGELTRALVGDAAEVEPVEFEGSAEPAAAFRVLGVREVSERPHRMRFVGRERELALVGEAWERVQVERRCELVTIVGDAGIGKSRLVAELLSSSEELIVRGRCLPYGEGITYWPVVEVLKQLELPSDEVAAAAIRSLLGETDSIARAEEIAWAFRKTLEHAAGRRPLVVVLDDIQWGEEAFLDLVEQVPLLSSGAGILLLCLARPDLVERRPTLPVTLRLAPLGHAEVHQLIPERISGRLRERIARAGGGNPLYIEGILAMHGESEDELVVVPPTLQALLAARLDQLEPGERSVLERGAIEGEAFHWGALQELAPEDGHLAPHLAALVRKGLIRPERTMLAGEDGFRFSHQLIRDAAYERLPKTTRAGLHERFAAWLEEHGARLVALDEIRGYHLEQAYRYRTEFGPVDDEARELAGRAARRLGLAGRRAVDRGDVRAVVSLLGRATALLPPDSLERLDLMLPYGYALSESGRTPEAWTIYENLAEQATALGLRGLAARARFSRLVFKDLGPDAWRVTEELIETFTELGDETGLAQAKRGLGMVCRSRGRVADSAVWFERALVHANACGDLVTRRLVTQSLSMALCHGPVPVADATVRCEELGRANHDDRVLDAVIARHLSSLYAMAGRFDDARESWEWAGLVLDEANMVLSSWVSEMHSAGAKELAGDRAGAERDLKAMWLHCRDALGGAPDLRAMHAAYRLAYLYCDEGRWDDAEECLAFRADVPAPENATTASFRPAAAARLAAHRGELVEAAMLARSAVETAEATDMLNMRALVWLALAEVRRASGERAEADVATAAALGLYERKGNVAAADRLRAGAVTAQSVCVT